MRAHVLTYQRVLGAYVLTCKRVLGAYVLMYLACLRANVPCVFTCSRANVPSLLSCSRLTCFLALFLSFPYEIKLCMKNARKTCRYDTTMSLDTFILNIQLYTPAIKWLDFCLSANLRVIFKSLINSGRWIVTSLS